VIALLEYEQVLRVVHIWHDKVLRVVRLVDNDRIYLPLYMGFCL